MESGGAPHPGSEPPSQQQYLEHIKADIERLNLEIERSYKSISLGRLAAGVVHEINSPIASIFSNIEVLQKSLTALEQQCGEHATPRATQLIESMRSLLAVDRMACERISGIIRSLKIHVRLEDDKFAPIKLNELLDDTIRLVNAEYKRRIKILTNYGDMPAVECRAEQMGQVFLNVLVNAAQAIEDEGTITVRTALEGNQVRVSITDSGAGMSEEIKRRLFTSGFTTKPTGVGTGLGLSISARIVEHHKGSITFESKLGGGTTFNICIPLRHTDSKES